MSWDPFFGKQGHIVQPLRQERVQLLVSGLNAREINRHGAKRVAQASTAELSDSRSSRERPRRQAGTIDCSLWQNFPLAVRTHVMDNEQVCSCCNQEGARQTSQTLRVIYTHTGKCRLLRGLGTGPGQVGSPSRTFLITRPRFETQDTPSRGGETNNTHLAAVPLSRPLLKRRCNGFRRTPTGA